MSRKDGLPKDQGVVHWAQGSSPLGQTYQAGCHDQLDMRAWNWSAFDCSNTLRPTRARSRRSQLGQCKTLLRQQLFSRLDSKIYERGQRHTQLAPAVAWGPRLPQLWSEVAVGRGDEVKGKGKEGGEGVGGSRSPVRPPQNKGRLAATDRWIFLSQLRDLPAWSCGCLTGGERHRLLRDVDGA